jgi:hypothetical protein
MPKSAFEPIVPVRAEKPVPMNANHAFGLDFEDFLPVSTATSFPTLSSS